MAKKRRLSRAKAREMLHDKTAHGRPLTEAQRGYFGRVASGHTGPPDPKKRTKHKRSRRR